MNKTELTAAILEKCSGDIQTKAAAARIVDTMLDTITETVVSGDEVSIAGFGTFKTIAKAARTGRNPQTGKSIKIPATKVPKFKAGKSFKDAVKTSK